MKKNNRHKMYKVFSIFLILILFAAAIARNEYVYSHLRQKTEDSKQEILVNKHEFYAALKSIEDSVIYTSTKNDTIIIAKHDTVTVAKIDTVFVQPKIIKDLPKIKKNKLQRRHFEEVESTIPISPGKTITIKSRKVVYD